MTIHGGSSLDDDAPYKVARCEDLAPCEGVDKAWYSPGKRLLVVALGTRRYETIFNVAPHEIERCVHAAREADARKTMSGLCGSPAGSARDDRAGQKNIQSERFFEWIRKQARMWRRCPGSSSWASGGFSRTS